MRSLVVGVIAAVVLVGAAAGPVGAAGPSRPLDMQVVDASGQPVSGAGVALAVMPSGREAGPGRAVAAKGTRTTNTRGRASWPQLRLTKHERRLAAANGGWLNLTALALDADGQPIGASTFSRYVGSGVAVAQQPTTVARIRTGANTPARTQATIAATCTWPSNYRWELASTSAAWTAVGELHVAGDSKATLTYGKTADSSIDAAFKVGGTWSLGGSVHIGNTSTSSVSQTLGPYIYRHVLSRFEYGLWKLYSDCAEGWHVYRGYDHTEATRWLGGITYDTTSIGYYDNHRTAYWNLFGRNSSFSRSTNAMQKVQFAVTVFGVNLGAQSGS
ncbi:MAG TPA: hypothetical protein VFS32_15410, partial [Candidatus Limnocylindrales bacterium]|nr:hypothetical protein [Candidatus Limnocylindrales bacterium]